MTDYTVAVGTHDPYPLSASSDADAIRQAVAEIEARYADDLRLAPEVVVTVMGPSGLLSRPSERIDEFVRRAPGPHPAIDAGMVLPGDTNSPDCNGD